MKLFHAALLLAVFGNVLYHLSQKSIPASVHPVVSVLVSYLTASMLALPLLLVFPTQHSFAVEVAKVQWPSLGVGVAIVVVELAFLLAYRAGWRVSVASVTANTMVALVLLPIGLVFSREQLTLLQFLGIVLCLTGLALLVSA